MREMGSEVNNNSTKKPPSTASLSLLLLSTKCFPVKPSSPPPAPNSLENKGSDEMNGHGAASPYLSAKAASAAAIQKKPGGWKAMPYILGLSLSLVP